VRGGAINERVVNFRGDHRCYIDSPFEGFGGRNGGPKSVVQDQRKGRRGEPYGSAGKGGDSLVKKNSHQKKVAVVGGKAERIEVHARRNSEDERDHTR